MQRYIRLTAAALVTSGSLTLAACGGHHDRAADRAPATTANGEVAPAPAAPAPDTAYHHHSKLGGALVGAAAGHAMGGHAVLGAAAGALVQHERNKHHR